jgi:putative MFS transporter
MGETAPLRTAPIAEAAAGSIAGRLDALPRAWPAWQLIVLVSLGGWFEFYDLMMTAYISPGLVHAGVFHEGKAGLLGQSDQATFAAATFLGLFIGTVAFARVADRFGRRAIFTASLIWYAIATLAMAASTTALQLILWRLVAGIGIGVELVTIDAFISEIAPARIRGRAFAVNQAIQFTAVPAVAFACWRLLPLALFGIAGWRWVMIIGATGAGVVWVIRAGLPESPRWLERHGRLAEADTIVRRLEGRRLEGRPPAGAARSAPAAAAAPIRSEVAGQLAEAFSPTYRTRTLMLTVLGVFHTIGYYGFANWAPSLIATRGHSVIHSLGYAFAIAAAYPLGPLLCAAFADCFERKAQIIVGALTTAVLGLAFARQSAPALLIALGVGVTFSNNLTSFAYHAYMSELYPTRFRAAAVGFVYSWSRLSTVFSSFIIAALLTGFGAPGVFVFIASAMAVVVLDVWLLGPRTAGRRLESLAV